MGYIVILAIGGIALVLIAASALSGSRRKGGKTLRADDVTPQQPAGEELTPGASSTSSQPRIEAAQRRVDPS